MKRLLLGLSLSVGLLLVLMGSGVKDANAIGHYTIPGTYEGCIVCHDFINGEYAGAGNLRWVNDEITWDGSTYTGVTYTCDPGEGTCTDGTLADGNPSDLDGPCEVCHDPTTIAYHTNPDDGTTHLDGEDCLVCHPHFADDIDNFFQPTFKGNQSHLTHLSDLVGEDRVLQGPLFGYVYPGEECTQCHLGGDYSLFADGLPIGTTTVCDPCHSPGGDFDGSAEGKAKWEEGVYADVQAGILNAGNDNWCATCHDEGSSEVNGVSAPNVMGDNSTWGYNIGGHGKTPDIGATCDDCHAFNMLHTDFDPRSYSSTVPLGSETELVDLLTPPSDYQYGYRLKDTMVIPRNGEAPPQAFKLCLNCHLYTDITGPGSNFRDDAKGLQFHDLHTDDFPTLQYADTDFDVVIDSALTCISCHNVHGSKSGAMVRSGELISTPTLDKTPALDFHWYEADQTTETTDVNSSFYGKLICGVPPTGLSTNYVCTGCHRDAPPSDPLVWYRDAASGPEGMTLDAIYTSDTNDNPKTQFYPGETFRVHVEFTVNGGPYFIQIKDSGVGNLGSMPGTNWVYPISAQATLPAAPPWEGPSYDVWWEAPIPTSADPGSPAILLINIAAYDGVTVVDQYEQVWNFDIVAGP